MTDKLKDQDASAPAATEKKPKVSLKTRVAGNVIINPPEKVDPQRGFQERFKVALARHTVLIENKTAIVLQAKASSADLPADVLEQVYIRGFKALPQDSELTNEQYAMNRVNSFIAGGAAMVEDFDLLPIYERVGMKGTGGAMRPHIKREVNVYNGRKVYRVLNKAGRVMHTATDEFAAKKHLAAKYQSYNESTASPLKRFEGTKSLVKTYKEDTPGEKKNVSEASATKLQNYIRASSGDAINRQNIANRTGVADPKIAKRNAGQETAQRKLRVESRKPPKPQADQGDFKPLLAKLTPQRGKGSFEMKIKEGIEQGSIKEASSAAVRLQKAFQKAKEQTERERKLGNQLMSNIKTAPKQPTTKMHEMKVATDRSQYNNLDSADSSIYDRKIGELKPGKMSDKELEQAQNRKIQIQRKIIDNA